MRVIDGDITEMVGEVVCHQVNCAGAIGAGVSGAIIRKWPKVLEAYKRQYPRALLGDWYDVTQQDGTVVYNIFSQQGYGNAARTKKCYTDMGKLEHALRIIACRHETVYVPYGIGCGLAGGDWQELSTRLSDVNNIIAVRRLQTG